MKYHPFAWMLFLVILLFSACAKTSNTLEPPLQVQDSHAAALEGTFLLGLYEITLDPDTETAEVVPLRSAEVEVNVLRFLEPGSGPSKILLDNFEWNVPMVSCDVGLQHPFPGLNEYNGFSVRGVVLTNGTQTGYENPAFQHTKLDELRLLNADGHTRWMNPREFPTDGTIFSYHPGHMGDPNGVTYHSTLNPYKLYADDLAAEPDSLVLNELMLAMFSAGSTNWRRYELDFGTQDFLKFQYAVVASTDIPTTTPPNGPEDWPEGTVMSEPYLVRPILTNTLWYENGDFGGELSLEVQVRDFENPDQVDVYAEAPFVFPKQSLSLVSQGGNESMWELDVQNIGLSSFDTFQMLIAAVATDHVGYDGLIPGEEVATYMLVEVTVLDEEPPDPGWPFYDDFETTDYIWTPMKTEPSSELYWGKYDGFMDATGGGMSYEEDNDSPDENPNVSYVVSPPIEIPASSFDLVMTMNHTLKVDIPEEWGNFAWDMCFVRVNNEQVFPTGGPAYENNYYPWTFDPVYCWTSEYPEGADGFETIESVFNLGTEYNGTTINVEFVLDTYDYIWNSKPMHFGWKIDDVLLDFDD